MHALALLTCLLAGYTAARSIRGNHLPRTGHADCTDDNITIRREWGALSRDERLAYIDAVKCLKTKPSNGQAPGAQNHFDDFTAIHIAKTMQIHLTGTFLVWHRHFIWLFEKALKEECGYTGGLPFWNWPLSANDLSASPLFDGSDTSLSGDGEYLATDDPNYIYPTIATTRLPRGSGGGCVRSGPFANTTLSFQRFNQGLAFQIAFQNGSIPTDALEYRPHCFARDLNVGVSQSLNQSAVSALLNAPDIETYSAVLNGVGSNPNASTAGLAGGSHNAGHYSLGPDMFDFFASPQDPAFFLHHAMVDLTYTEWQKKDPCTREKALTGTKTFLDTPPSENVTLADVMDFGKFGTRVVGSSMKVGAEGYCYRYEYEN